MLKKKISFTVGWTIFYFAVLGYPTAMSFLNPSSIDEGHMQYSLFFRFFFLAYLLTTLLMVFDIIVCRLISEAPNDLERSKRIRKTYRVVSNTGLFAFLITIALAFTSVFNGTNFAIYFGGFLLIYCIIGAICLGGFRVKDNNITLDEIKGDFILYLRAFSEDVKSLKEKARPGYFGGFNDFIEDEFFRFLPFSVAVGQPNELLPPMVANRIYFKESEWKNSVDNLIEKASLIIILISSNRNCIWEIERIQNRINRVIFIVQNYDDYVVAKSKVGNKILPEITKNSLPIMFYFDTNGKIQFLKFNNNVTDYVIITQEIKNVFKL